MTQNFLNFVKHINPQIQEAQWISSQINTSKHILAKPLKTKDDEKIFKAEKKETLNLEE